MIEHFLRQFDPRDVALMAFLAGMWFSDKRVRGVLREHGKRLGALGSRINRTETHLQLPPPALRVGDEGGNGE